MHGLQHLNQARNDVVNRVCLRSAPDFKELLAGVIFTQGLFYFGNRAGRPVGPLQPSSVSSVHFTSGVPHLIPGAVGRVRRGYEWLRVVTSDRAARLRPFSLVATLHSLVLGEEFKLSFAPHAVFLFGFTLRELSTPLRLALSAVKFK